MFFFCNRAQPKSRTTAFLITITFSVPRLRWVMRPLFQNQPHSTENDDCLDGKIPTTTLPSDRAAGLEGLGTH